jgi:hypothetical protein
MMGVKPEKSTGSTGCPRSNRATMALAFPSRWHFRCKSVSPIVKHFTMYVYKPLW